jgi:glycosyltransferase involved in cell wall biosynthesis
VEAAPPFIREIAGEHGFPWREFPSGREPDLDAADAVICHVAHEAPPHPEASRRVLRCMAAGKAVIASASGANLPFLRPGRNAVVPRTRAEWAECLARLRRERGYAEELGRNARRTAGSGLAERPVVAFVLGEGLERWDETSLRQGIGGSETAAIQLARQLSRLGYDVQIFADPAEEHWDESGDRVQYLRHEHWARYAYNAQIDHLVCSRMVAPLKGLNSARRRYVWIHDIGLGPVGDEVCLPEVDHYLCLSDWHRQFVHEQHGIPLERIRVTTNGVDPARYAHAGSVPRDPRQVIYSSSPDRGLDTLLEVSDAIARHVPGFTVQVAYGFQTWEALIRYRDVAAEVAYMERIRKLMGKPCVRYLGRISQEELARRQAGCGAWLYPTRFTETNCITAIEAGQAGCAILTSHLAGLITTVGDDGGILLRGDAYSAEYRERFVEEAVRLLTDGAYRDEWAERARRKMRKLTWAQVAEQWHQLFSHGRFERITGEGGE